MVFLPDLAKEFIRCETAKGFEAPGKIIGSDEVSQMLAEMVVGLVVEALDGRFLDRSVHPLDLAIRPGMARFCQAMLDIEIGAGQLEGVTPDWLVCLAHGFDIFGRPSVAGRIGEMRAIVSYGGIWVTGAIRRRDELKRQRVRRRW